MSTATKDGTELFGEGISELSSRSGNGVDVALVWQRCDDTAMVVVVDRRTGEEFVLDVQENDNALDMFHHPYAYAASRLIHRGSLAQRRLSDRSMKPTISDNILRDAVVQELESDPEVGAKHISVTAIDGAITLRGHVARDHEKHAAVRAVERVRAVRAVADDIEVRPPSLHERADDEIAEEIAHLRSWRAQIPDSVSAQVRDGRVILHGQAESTAQRDAAESAVRPLTGVRVVDNLIEVKTKDRATAAWSAGATQSLR